MMWALLSKFWDYRCVLSHLLLTNAVDNSGNISTPRSTEIDQERRLRPRCELPSATLHSDVPEDQPQLPHCKLRVGIGRMEKHTVLSLGPLLQYKGNSGREIEKHTLGFFF